MARIEETEEHVTERPDHAPHVVARWERPRVEDGVRQPQKIELRCERCDTVHLVVCETGQVRRHVMNFAVAHLHRDPLG